MAVVECLAQYNVLDISRKSEATPTLYQSVFRSQPISFLVEGLNVRRRCAYDYALKQMRQTLLAEVAPLNRVILSFLQIEHRCPFREPFTLGTPRRFNRCHVRNFATSGEFAEHKTRTADEFDAMVPICAFTAQVMCQESTCFSVRRTRSLSSASSRGCD